GVAAETPACFFHPAIMFPVAECRNEQAREHAPATAVCPGVRKLPEAVRQIDAGMYAGNLC
ncbi:MAG: hypothetical protein RQ750_18835, partial [Roseovarius sp.]|nr:hypothetical protein [Roseovarius sp.]